MEGVGDGSEQNIIYEIVKELTKVFLNTTYYGIHININWNLYFYKFILVNNCLAVGIIILLYI